VDDKGAVNRGDEDTLKMQAQVTKALRPAYEELARALPEQRRLGIDESPTKEAGAKSLLWTYVAGLFRVFAARGTRAAKVLSEFLTDAFAGAPGRGVAPGTRSRNEPAFDTWRHAPFNEFRLVQGRKCWATCGCGPSPKS
jgi:hypothetical protein